MSAHRDRDSLRWAVYSVGKRGFAKVFESNHDTEPAALRVAARRCRQDPAAVYFVEPPKKLEPV